MYVESEIHKEKKFVDKILNYFFTQINLQYFIMSASKSQNFLDNTFVSKKLTNRVV